MLVVLLVATTLTLTGGVTGLPVAQATAVAFVAKGSVNQVYTYGHTPGDAIELWASGGGAALKTGVADANGALLFREVPTGSGYEVRNTTAGTSVGDLTVMDPTVNPPFSAYQAIDLGAAHPGSNTYTYIPTRDGTLLSANITFPKDGSPGPWPVVVDYSGYDPSQPPNPPQEAVMWPYLGYVTVGVNLRGTTCSGGAFDIWETLQTLDGYDVIETLAAQSWSTGDVGMVGISFPGISQLFVAQTQPPHLRAITPLSTYADFYTGIGYPGGIINDGFFLDWLKSRDADADPAAHTWVQKRINELGDTTCAQNQVMHRQAHKVIPEALPGRFYETRGDYLSPKNFVNKIKVPVLLAGQYQDEQTGGQWATMIKDFDPATKLKVQMTNGTHVESLGPEHLARVMEFVDFYVGKRIPSIPITLRMGAQMFYKDLMGTSLGYLPEDRFPQFEGQTYPQALAAYEAEPMIHIWWENGSGPTVVYGPGEPFSSAQGDYASFPLPGTTPVPLYFEPDGALSLAPPSVADNEPRGFTSYEYDPDSKIVDPTFARPRSTFNGSTDQMWKPLPAVKWKPLTEGNSVSFVTDALPNMLALAGSASADVYVRSTELDTDLEVTLTEVRPDGKETFIQGGWLRASRRKVEPASTVLWPVHSHLEADAQPLTAGEFSLARVEIYPFAHVLRAGSRLRVNVEVPGGNQAFWQITPMSFDHQVVNDIAHSIGRPSRVVLPVIPPALKPHVPLNRYPACPGLRGQACRDYLPARRPTNVNAVVQDNALATSWIAPPGTAPDSYTVHVSPTGQSFVVPGSQTTFVLEGPSLDTPYSFTVAATYGATTAPPSDASLLVSIPSTVPSPPHDVVAVAGDASADVSWTAPGNDGGQPVTGYTVTADPGGATCTTTGATMCSVSGLANGTPYTFTVTATNGVGTSQPSAASAPVTPQAAATVPQPPTDVSGVSGDGSVSVSWTAPADDGGSTITGYTVTADPGGATCSTAGPTSCTVSGLTNGSPYTFTVVATNAVGPSQASVASAAVVPATVPDAPTAVKTVRRDAAVTVSWTAPAGDGGAPISGYTVTADPGGATCTTAGALRCSVNGLANGTPYTFTVTATNAAGTGAPSAASAASTPLAICGDGRPGPFPDVPGTHPFCDDIDWLAAAGVTTGYLDGTFRPNDAVTRQAMASFLWKYAGSPAPTLTEPFFADVPATHPFYDAIQWMAETGLSVGTPQVGDKPLYKASDPVSRQAMAAFLWRRAGQPAPQAGDPFFFDVGTGSPFYDAIQWMGQTGISTGTPYPPYAPYYKPNDPVSRQAMAAFVHRFDALV